MKQLPLQSYALHLLIILALFLVQFLLPAYHYGNLTRIMVYAVLVILFGTFLQPVTILFSLPLSIGGAIAALLLTGHQLTIPVWIGVLMLMGIVTKNAIMLVEFSIGSIRKGMDRDAAIVDAGQKRARPIIMTTIAMVAGMVPSASAVCLWFLS